MTFKLMSNFINFNKYLSVKNQFNYYNFSIRSFKMSSYNFEQASEELKQNPYYDKYSHKIDLLQKKAPKEFLNRFEKIKKQEPKQKAILKDLQERAFSSPLNPKPDLTNTSSFLTKKKVLNDIFKIDLVKDKNAEEITEIWTSHYKNKESNLSGVIPLQLYEKIESTSKKHPLFIFPLPRGQGYEFILSQFTENEIHYTPLISYQTHKENAVECMTLVHYTELSEKSIVLMHGEFDKNILAPNEAQCLIYQLQLFYGNDDKKKILSQFTHSPDSFNHMDLIGELENLSIS